MNQSLRFGGLPVSEGTATGVLYIAAAGTVASATPGEVRAAFAAVSAARSALADRLRGAGRGGEAAIIDVGALIAQDPGLVEPAVAAVRGGAAPALAVHEAAEAHATALEALPSPELAERAGDVRQVAHAVLDVLGAAAAMARPTGNFILIRSEVSPADLIELAEAGLVGAVSVSGGASSHAAIIARGLGVPMISGVDSSVLAIPAGQLATVDGDSGQLIIGPAAVMPAATRQRADQAQAQLQPSGPARTVDGRQIAVQCNVASAAETRRGLAAGAEGVGLLRTEIPYTAALAWPTLAGHRAQLAPILDLLAGRPATVRLLDFSGDKIPPFLDADSGGGRRDGLAALLAHGAALPDQLRAILETGRLARLAMLIPMVRSLGEVDRVREVLGQACTAVGVDVPPLGIMVELAATAAAAEAFAAAADFFSIGTNDLTGDVLGFDRHDRSAGPALAAHPQVLALISHVAEAGRRAGIPVSVCGDAAADPLVLPLLVGLGVQAVSVPAARVQRVRSRLAELDTAACAALAAAALSASTTDEVRQLMTAAPASAAAPVTAAALPAATAPEMPAVPAQPAVPGR